MANDRRQMDKFEIEACTAAAYEVHRQFCKGMGDFSHVPYESLPNDLKEVARNATIGIVTLGFTSEQSHEAWVSHKRSQGWIRGEEKDAVKKTHPCLVPFKELPFEQQAKDDLWISTVKNLMAAFTRIPNQ